jgi:hypothetical protein
MQCANPFIKDGLAFGCGSCPNCRINKKREWSHRIMLEAAQYQDNNFITLTYDEDHLPENGDLVPRHLQLFIKRLRRSFEPQKLRYFAVGEYGETTQRPHYHLAVFGYPTCSKSTTYRDRAGHCCPVCDSVQSAWSDGYSTMGYVYCGQLTPESAQYIAGYVTKKLTSHDDERLEGRHPEFARMSNRPGIGAGMMDEMASELLKYPLDDLEDVPGALRHGSRLLPLGRYLKGRLRERIGRDKKAPKIVLEKAIEKMRPMREAAFATAPSGSKLFTFKQMVIDSGAGKRARVKAKDRKKKGSI